MAGGSGLLVLGLSPLGEGKQTLTNVFGFHNCTRVARIEHYLLYYTGTTVIFRRTKIVVETAVQQSSTVYSQHCLDACYVYAV